jgi:hypothetical protein
MLQPLVLQKFDMHRRQLLPRDPQEYQGFVQMVSDPTAIQVPWLSEA